MHGPHWTSEGLRNFGGVFLLYSAIVLPLGLRRDWLPALTAGALLVLAAVSHQLLALIAVLVVMLICSIIGDFAKVPGATGIALGLASIQTVIAITAWLPIHYTALYWLACGVCLWFRRASVLRMLEYLRPTTLTWSNYLAFYVLGFVLLCHVWAAMLPEVSSDGLTMHLTVLEILRFEHVWKFDPTRYSWAVMPMGGDWSFAPAHLMAGEAAARLMNFAALCLVVRLIWSLFTFGH